MSKRISNSRINRMRPGRLAAHFGRIRYGWRSKRALSNLEKTEELLTQEGLEDELKVRYENVKSKLKSVLPKNLLRRHQGR